MRCSPTTYERGATGTREPNKNEIGQTNQSWTRAYITQHAPAAPPPHHNPRRAPQQKTNQLTNNPQTKMREKQHEATNQRQAKQTGLSPAWIMASPSQDTAKTSPSERQTANSSFGNLRPLVIKKYWYSQNVWMAENSPIALSHLGAISSPRSPRSSQTLEG